MNIPKKNSKNNNSPISKIHSHIPKNNKISYSFDITTSNNYVKNISHDIPSKINTPIEFIRQRKKFVLLNSFDKNWTKYFLEQKEKALIEIKLDDEILEENNSNSLEYKRNNNKKKYNSLKKKSEYIINGKINQGSDIYCNSKINQYENAKINALGSKYKIDEKLDVKLKKEIKTKEKKIRSSKNQVNLRKSSITKIKVYNEDNIKDLESLFNFSQKRKKLMRIDDDIEDSYISRDNMEKKNNVKLLGKNYKKIFNEVAKEIINNSKIDSVRIILEELM